MLQKFRNAASHALMLGVEATGAFLAGSGAAVALFLGKLFAAAALAAITLGIFLRLASRRRKMPAEPAPAPPWLQFACALLALVETAALTEATNLPVRGIQPGFQKSNWILVLAALAALYLIQLRFFRSLRARRAEPSADQADRSAA